MSNSTKVKDFKGQSRVLKVCHWCGKKQDPKQKSFQACGRCKEVIYCSKERQVASWPLHKAPCKASADVKKKIEEGGNPNLTNTIATFKKWHSMHNDALRHAAVCALNLGYKPKAVNENFLFIEITQKPDHQDLPIKRKYAPTGGFTMTLEEVESIFRDANGLAILESFKESNEHMQKKGGVGIVGVLLEAHGVMDLVKIILPTPSATKLNQMADNWGEFWLPRLQAAVEAD
ncbi:hypothetical protein CPB83DRAFT_848472 [Crepidotus variabilis]|uniref:MYND-type domain-containing protein n=1 Tax=Crepidotus variabilis TaxID=179855 RepID=A0A9P6JTJ2_9AGAR|nr:hypothetical protein CPB83DRAFT_848472 [Crepidotus variabilis]